MFLPRLIRLGLLLACFVVASPVGADAIPGAPLMRHFSVEDTQVTPGHLALATGADGQLFVGSLEGVLSYNGVEWTLTELPGRSPARALATGADGRVYVGGYDTFGRLALNAEGSYIYEELLTAAGLRDAQRHVGIVWEVLPLSDGIYFRAEDMMHFLPYGGGDARRWPLPEEVRSFSIIGDRLYARVHGRGLCRFDSGEFELLPGGDVFAEQPLPGLVDRGDWMLAVGQDGLYRVDAEGIQALAGEGSDAVRATRSYAVQALEDGSVVVASLDGDLFRLDAALEVRERVELGSFGIQALGLDNEGGLWAATEGNLVRLNLPSPWSFIGPAQGLLGTPNDFEWHEDALWLATSRGVLRLTHGPRGLRTEHPRWTNFEAYALHADTAGLLIGVREGLRVLDPGARTPRTLHDNQTDGVFALAPSRFDPGLVFAFTSPELLLVRVRAGRWQITGRVPLDGISLAGLEESARGELWLGDTRGPVQRWRVDLETGQLLERATYADAAGLVVDPQAGTSVYQLDGRIHAISGRAGFRLEGDRFMPDNAPPFTLVDRPFELTVQETPLGAYAYTSRQIWHRPPGGQDWRALYPGAQQAVGYSYLRVNQDGVLRISTWAGLLQFDPDEHAPRPEPLQLRIESVLARGPGDADGTRLASDNRDGPVRVAPGHSLNLRFAMVSMESGAEFRYLLHGITPDWSGWSDRDLFIRALPAGDYALEVQARTRNGRQAAALTYRFQVQPYWWEHWWVYMAALLMLGALAVGITLWVVRRRTERYLAANRRLEARIAERTHELEDLNRRLAELVTEDALTGVANRRALENGLRREWLRCLDQRRPLSVLMIDVDHFKAYNDAHGHLEGDVQLRGIAQRLSQQHDPQRELLARYGGEEFAMLLPGVHVTEAQRRAEAIRAAISASDAGMTVSVGVAGFVPDLQSDPDTLLRRADAALYTAKRTGRNRVEVDAG